MSGILRVASYNLHSCIGGDRQCNPERTVKLLHELDADILALQEVGTKGPVFEFDQFPLLEKHLGLNGVRGPNVRRGRNQFGNAVFTRGEILNVHHIDLAVSPFEPRGAIDCLIRLHGREIRVIAVHLGLFPHERRQQLNRLAAVLAQRVQPLTVLLGDFNVFGPERRTLQICGAPAQLPKLRTFPARRPIMSLDRIWTIPNHSLLQMHDYKTSLSRQTSDHLPVIGEIEFLPARHARGGHHQPAQPSA